MLLFSLEASLEGTDTLPAPLDRELQTSTVQVLPHLFLLDVLSTQFCDLLICPSTPFHSFFNFGFCILNKSTHSKLKKNMTIVDNSQNDTYEVFLLWV